MKSYSVEAFVLRMRPLGEADRILTLFSRERGKLTGVAKGVRKTQSKFGARLEFMARSALLLHTGRSLDVITSARLVSGAWEQLVIPEVYSLASYLAEEGLETGEAVNGAEFKIDMRGNRSTDFDAANQALMDRLRTDSAFRQQFGVDENWIKSMTAADEQTVIRTKMNEWISETNHWTWHHSEDMQTMQLVRQDVHNVAKGGVAHTGGASYAQGTLRKLKDLGLITEQEMKAGLTPALIDNAKQNGIIPAGFPS